MFRQEYQSCNGVITYYHDDAVNGNQWEHEYMAAERFEDLVNSLKQFYGNEGGVNDNWIPNQILFIL